MSADNQPVCVIAMRPGKLAKLTKEKCEHTQLLRQAAHELASRRAKVEYVFRDIKVRFGVAKNRYLGLTKSAARFTFRTAIANVLRGDNYGRRRPDCVRNLETVPEKGRLWRKIGCFLEVT